jgi:small conductance mechanosensitive channel
MEIDFSNAIDNLNGMIDGLIGSLPNIAVALLVFILFYLFAWITRLSVRRISDRYRRNYNLGLVLGRLAQWTVVMLGLLVALVIIFPNFSPAQLVQILGIGSVAISFAFRDILENFLAGIILLLTEPFRVGDQIKMEEVEGTVEEIDTRASMIRTYDGRRIVIPNGKLFTNIVTVNTAYDKRRLEYDIGVSYEEDLRLSKDLILEAMREVNGVLKDPPPEVIMMDLGDFSVILRARWWISPPLRRDALETHDAVLSRVKEKLTTHGIEMPFPTQQVLLQNQVGSANGKSLHPREG